MKKVHTTVHTVLLPWRSFGCKCLLFKKQKAFISLQLNDIYCNAHKGTVICTSRSNFLHLNHHTGKEIMKIEIFTLRLNVVIPKPTML